MTTVAQMIEWMKTLPQDAEVECGVERTKGYDTFMVYRPAIPYYCDILDYTSEKDREMYPDMAGKVIIRINGE